MDKSKSTKTLLIAVVYDEIEDYLKDYFTSINQQDTECFDLFLLLDGYTGNIERFITKKFKIILNVENKNPAEIRQIGINYAISNGYDNLIFSDADDYFSNNRIRLSIEWLNNYDFVYNDLILIDTNAKIISETYSSDISTPQIVDDLDTIIDYNIFGLTHTAVKVDKLRNLEIPKDQLAVDWYIFSILLLNGAIGKRLENVYTYYRQYEDNYVGALFLLTERSLDRGLSVKCNHYKEIVRHTVNNKILRYVDKYNEKLILILEMIKWIMYPTNKKNYIAFINKYHSAIYRGWWSNIVTKRDLEEKYGFLSGNN